MCVAAQTWNIQEARDNLLLLTMLDTLDGVAQAMPGGLCQAVCTGGTPKDFRNEADWFWTSAVSWWAGSLFFFSGAEFIRTIHGCPDGRITTGRFPSTIQTLLMGTLRHRLVKWLALGHVMSQ